mmetsp:Transcript_26490/g.82735  ORF Transcript_26490/g.82735 Transcript_26490/m.82735 type:complete len:208 (-) Transcript_26490:2995-3618(-)
MAENGSSPAMNSCSAALWNQGPSRGISRGCFFVRHGGSKRTVVLRPTMPPTIVGGKTTKTKTARTTRMVVTGSAARDPCASAVVFTKQNTTKSGAGNTRYVQTMFQTQLRPSSWRYSRPATRPPRKAVMLYATRKAVTTAPRFVARNMPQSAAMSTSTTVAQSCAPAPDTAESSSGNCGVRNTSPLMSFQPVSSSLSGSSAPYSSSM